MFTWGSKYFIGLGAAMLVAAVVYALVSGGGPLGGVTLGWYQGVGDHLGFAVLIGTGLALVLLGVLAVWARDAEAEDVAAAIGAERVPQALPPVNPSYWGAVAGFGVGALLIGASVSTVFLLVGFVILAVVAAEWLVLAWSDQATGDPAANRTIRNRLMLPIEVPLFGAIGIGLVVLGLSRVFLAVPKVGSVVAASVLATVVFAAAVAFAYRPRWFSGNVLSGLVAGFAALILVGGVVAAAVGPREFEVHLEEEHHEEEHHEGEGEIEEGEVVEGEIEEGGEGEGGSSDVETGSEEEGS